MRPKISGATTLRALAACTVLLATTLEASGSDVDQGVELYEQERYQDAARVLERAVDAHPNDPRAWSYLGLARVHANQLAAGRKALEKAIALENDSAQAHFGLGLVHGYANELEESIAELSRAVALDPSHAYAHYHLGLAANAAGKPDRTILHLNRFLELAPDAPEADQVRDLVTRLR